MDLRRVGIRILVTGTRGKSSLVRLLHAGLSAVGLRTHSRVTGVLPRELSPAGQRVIRRTSPVSFREMQEGKRIDLSTNFRSKPWIIDAVNGIFRPIMEGYDDDRDRRASCRERV